MKKRFGSIGFIGFISAVVVVALLLFGGLASAQTWFSANQKQVAWEPVTTLTDGSAIPAGDIIKYRIFLAPLTEGTADKTNPLDLGLSSEPIFLISIPREGKYFVGVQALRFDANNQPISPSEISWSDVAAACEGGATFGLQFTLSPGNVGGIRVQKQ